MPEYVPASQLPDSSIVDRQPVGVAAAVLAFVNAVVGCAILFGADITVEQAAGIGLVVNTGGVLVGALWTWRRVSPVRRVDPPPNHEDAE